MYKTVIRVIFTKTKVRTAVSLIVVGGLALGGHHSAATTQKLLNKISAGHETNERDLRRGDEKIKIPFGPPGHGEEAGGGGEHTRNEGH